MRLVGASPAGGFSMKACTRPVVGVGTTPNADGSSTGREVHRALGAAVAVEGHQGGHVEVGEHVAVDHHEGVVDEPGGRRAAKRMAPAVSSGSGSTA